jgi:hypothetical protein
MSARTNMGGFSSLDARSKKSVNVTEKTNISSESKAESEITGEAKSTVSMTIRLSNENWRRIGELKFTDGLNFQQAVMEGLNRVLQARGQKPLTEQASNDTKTPKAK